MWQDQCHQDQQFSSMEWRLRRHSRHGVQEAVGSEQQAGWLPPCWQSLGPGKGSPWQ